MLLRHALIEPIVTHARLGPRLEFAMDRSALVGPMVTDARLVPRVEFALCRMALVQPLRALPLLDPALATTLVTSILILADIGNTVAGDAVDAWARKLVGGRKRGGAKAGQRQGGSKDGQFDESESYSLLNEHK